MNFKAIKPALRRGWDWYKEHPMFQLGAAVAPIGAAVAWNGPRSRRLQKEMPASPQGTNYAIRELKQRHPDASWGMMKTAKPGLFGRTNLFTGDVKLRPGMEKKWALSVGSTNTGTFNNRASRA